jgi:hypothetical protein
MADNSLSSREERYGAALQRIADWSDAYPFSVFPKPDLKLADEVLTAVGLTLDAISADAMRHVIERAGRIAKEALRDE